jgi:hypothetical protein
MLNVPDIKRQVPVEVILQHYGSHGNAHARWRCLFAERHHHGDAEPSVTVKDGRAFCWSQGCFGEKGADVFELVRLREGLATFADQKRRVCEIGGIPANGKDNSRRREVDAYNYTDDAGNLLYQVVRYEPKDFRQRRPDGQNGWIWNLESVRRRLYRLTAVLADPEAVIVFHEGEACVHAALEAGLPGCHSTTSGGAGKANLTDLTPLRGRRVVIIPDNDDPGRRHGNELARLALEVGAQDVRLLHLPALPPRGDVADWLKRGGTAETFRALLDAADPWSETKPAGLPLTRLGDLLNEPESAVDWIVNGRLPVGGLSLLAAKPKAGKSTLARCLALAVSRGADFLGQPSQQGPVLYLALEEKRSEVRKHFKAMGAKDDPIFIFTSPSPQDGLDQLRLAAEREKPMLIIVDPLFKFVRVKDSNDYAAITIALEPLLTLARETGAHVLAVHHLGKGEREGGDAILGSTAIYAAVDTALLMKRTEKYRTLSSVQRYGEDLDEITLTFDPTSRTITAGPSRQEADTQEAAQVIVAFLTAQPEAAEEKTILEAVEGRRALKVKALRWLVETQAVIRSGKGGRGDPYRYSVSTPESCSPVPGHSRKHGNKNQEEPSGQGVPPVKAGSLDSCSPVPTTERDQENKNPPNAQTPCQDRQDSCSQDSGLFDSCSQGRQETREQKADIPEEVIDLAG